MNKPPQCGECEYRRVGSGFCPDWVPPAPRIAILCEAPGENEIVDGAPLSGATGRMFDYRFLQHLGMTRADVLIANTIRCCPPGLAYPTGELRRNAERACRIYDGMGGPNLMPGGLNAFSPNRFVLTIHPAALLRTWSLLRLVQHDVAKAFRMAAEGHRILLAMGDKAMGLVAPAIPGGVTRWRGHYGALDWPALQNRMRSV